MAAVDNPFFHGHSSIINTRFVLSFPLGNDYHWYRLDSDGKWSHKPGRTRASQYDNAGHYIHDPRHANMGDYRFVCFMSTDKHTVTIR